MFIRDILKDKADTNQTAVSFEIFPPKTLSGVDSVINTAHNLASLSPDFISVTYGAGGGTREYSASIAGEVQRDGVNALAHLTCVGSSAVQLTDFLATLKERHIQNVLALRGDILENQSTIPGFAHASDLVRLLRAEGFCVGGACYPEGHPESKNREDDLTQLKCKVDAGCDFLTTQMFFDNNTLYHFLHCLAQKGITVPVLAGIMPITTSTQVSKTISLSNATVPPALRALIARYENDNASLYRAGIEYAAAQITDLIQNGIRGIHLYTMNKSAIAREILAAL